MKHARTRLSALIVVPFLLALAPSADELGFHPAKDVQSQKKLLVEAEFRVEDVSFTVNGESGFPDEVLDELKSQALLMNLDIGVTETFRAASGGRPTDLLRTYEELSFQVEAGDEAQDVEEIAEFEGKTVRFVWDEEEQSYTKSYHESEGDEDALEELLDDMEVRCLLPDKQVAAGDTWSVSGAHLAPLFFPGGMPGSKSEEGGPDVDAIAEQLTGQMRESFKEFKVDCTYKGTKEVEGVRVGEIAFLYSGKSSLDLGPVLESVVESMGNGEVPPMDLSASAALALEGEGTLLWDLGAGVLHGYTMNAKAKFDVQIDVSAEQGGQTMDIEMSGALGGDVTWEMGRE